VIVLYLGAINIVAFIAMGLDKGFAERRERRIPERTLLWMALAGGAVGVLAARFALRHKTRKRAFSRMLWPILAGQAGVVLAWRWLDA
jgi:uncharacterized membrane protein YsdA (DUF1294 family)